MQPLARCGGQKGVQPHAGQSLLAAALRLRGREGLALGTVLLLWS